MKTLNELFYQVILLNELSGNQSAALRFSDPDGPSGRSGWSFGLCQFDTQHNKAAINCLIDCGFTDGEIKGIVKQSVDVRPLAARLIVHADIIARYDTEQLSHCLNSALNSATSKGVMISDPAAILCLADYVNQYGSVGDGFAAWLNNHDASGVASADIQEWKLNHTKYGREHPGDCVRRYNNILKVAQNV